MPRKRHPILIGFLGWACVPAALGLVLELLFTSHDLLFLTFAVVALIAGAIGASRARRDEEIRAADLVAVAAPMSDTRSRVWIADADLRELRARVEQLYAEREAARVERDYVGARLDAIVAGLRDGVVIVDAGLLIVTINGVAAEQFQTTIDAAIGKPLVEVARDYDLVRVVRESIATGRVQSTPIDYRRAGRQLNLRVLPVEQAGGRLAILVVQDITGVRQLENIRKDFVANVSHELRTPLAAIRALVETLNDGAPDDPSVAHVFLDRVVDEVDRLNELIEDLLALGRLESGRLPLRRTTIPVAELFRAAVERVGPDAERARITISTAIADDTPALTVDTSRMQQVLINLLANAIKFSPVSASVEMRASRNGGEVWIEVEDHGSGILPEDLSRIFERFYKSDRARTSDGTGLGLAIAKHIVSAHGGQIEAESEFDRGSLFRIRIPVGERSAPA